MAGFSRYGPLRGNARLLLLMRFVLGRIPRTLCVHIFFGRFLCFLLVLVFSRYILQQKGLPVAVEENKRR